MINFDKIIHEHKEASEKLSCEEVIKDRDLYEKLSKRFSFLDKLIKIFKEREKCQVIHN